MCCTAIDRIETAGPGSKARRLIFDDGSEPRLTSSAAVRELGLEAGSVVSPDELEGSLGEVEYRLAKERALRLLGYREHSTAELRHKLRDSGYPHAVAAAVTDRFVEVELVDDVRFANAWTRGRLNAGYGPRRIRQELIQRGIDPDVIETAFADSLESGDDVERARAALGNRSAHDRASKQKLVRRLVGRGFSVAVALKALEEASDDAFED